MILVYANMARLRVRTTPASLAVLCVLLVLVLSFMYVVFQYEPSLSNLIVSAQTRFQPNGEDMHTESSAQHRAAPAWLPSASIAKSTQASYLVAPGEHAYLCASCDVKLQESYFGFFPWYMLGCLQNIHLNC